MRFQTATLSRNGGRRDNEDYIVYKEEGGYTCWVVADGLGGHPGGALASRVVAEEIAKRFFSTKRIDVASIRLYMKTAHEILVQQQVAEDRSSLTKAVVALLQTEGTCDGDMWETPEFTVFIGARLSINPEIIVFPR